MPIPFLDLISLHERLEEELLGVVRRAIRTAQFIGGPEVEAFEEEFAAYCGVPYCAGVGSGTDAVRFALSACGAGRGDAVITVSHTFIATVEAICQVGAEPEFVDIDEHTYNLCPRALAAYLDSCDPDPATGRPVGRRSGRPVKAIVPVHLYGQPADMDAILDLAARYGLLVIEDAAQAHGAEYASRRFPEAAAGKGQIGPEEETSLESRRETGYETPETAAAQGPETGADSPPGGWRRAGALGHAAAFSFYPGKNLGACGEAGAVVSSDPEVVNRVKMIRDHGQAKKYYHEVEGYNGRLDAIQAGMLRVKLRHLDEWNAQRRAAAARYAELLAPVASPAQEARPAAAESCGADRFQGLVLPWVPPYARPVWHLYVVRVPNRDALVEHLKARGIGAALHYPIPVHLQKAYAHLGYRQGDLPVTERICREIVSLPMFPGLTSEQQAVVAEAVAEFLGKPRLVARV